MNRTSLSSLGLCVLALSACGPGEVVVSAEIQVSDPETGQMTTRAIGDLPVQLVPYDRDAIFDSLGAAAEAPEPQMPGELQVARDSIVEAQNEWRESENRWLALRERLQEISSEMEQYNPAEAQYRALFNEFDDAEQEALAAEATKDAAFERFDRLQQETFSELENFRAEVMAWEDQAFAPFAEVQAAKLQASGRDIVADTTDATGVVTLRPAPGEWWIYARFPFATEELYWNVPIQVERDVPVEVQLSRDNAEIRDIF